MKWRGFVGRLISGLASMKNLIKLSLKDVLISLGLTAAASATDVGMHQRCLRVGDDNTSN